MRQSRVSESRIIEIFKEMESGRHVKDACREHDISDDTCAISGGRSLGGVEASCIKRLRELEAKNRKLKLMVAGLSLEYKAIKEVLSLKH